MNELRTDAMTMIQQAISAVLPEAAVKKALRRHKFRCGLVMVAIGKAAWNMAHAAKMTLGEKIKTGIVITKYGHSKGAIPGCEIIEAGHPVPDEYSILAATKALDLVSGLAPGDQLLFLISGGGSALFEKPLDGVSLNELMDLTNQLLKCGANISEINAVRKHLSAVKGGRFALQCGGAEIVAVVLSDVVGDDLSVIASGPACPDSSTSAEALAILEKYRISISTGLEKAIRQETPKVVDNCTTIITGNVSALCRAAAKSATRLGYMSKIISTTIDGEAREMGQSLAGIAKELKSENRPKRFPAPPCAIIFGGETTVRIRGKGKGGRNQELALAAAIGIEDMADVVIFSVGSDGTDGPTDAAGGMVDGESVAKIRQNGLTPESYLENNDAYHALKLSNDLLITGPTGTNVNDLMVVLCK